MGAWWWLVALGVALAALVAVVLYRTLRLTSGQGGAGPVVEVALPGQEMAGRLAGALQFRTVSHQDPAQVDGDTFLGLHRYLEEQYPRAHAALQREVVADHSLLYTWAGSEKDLEPVLLMGHLDVVPADEGPEGGWTHPPFEGYIGEGFIWGRGTLDDKDVVLGLLEAVEILVTEGFQPRRTVYLAFGHDEEVGGARGAAQIAALLESRGVKLAYVLDEGLAVTEGMVTQVPMPVAMVGIAEKGYASVELGVRSEGGHSMMPPPNTAVGILSMAVHKLERNGFPTKLDGPARQLFCTLAPEMPFGMKMVFANLWLFGPLVNRQLAASPSTNAMVRTTTAPTMFQAGVKENILPNRARAVVNFRLLPGERIAGVLEHVRRTIDDPRVEIKLMDAFKSEPSFVSDTGSASFKMLVQTIGQVFAGVLVAPGLVLGGTDSRHYAGLSKYIYRFSPMWVRQEDLDRIHGKDERISVDGYERVVAFFMQLVRNSDEMEG